jgi:hypothetical protein
MIKVADKLRLNVKFGRSRGAFRSDANKAVEELKKQLATLALKKAQDLLAADFKTLETKVAAHFEQESTYLITTAIQRFFRIAFSRSGRDVLIRFPDIIKPGSGWTKGNLAYFNQKYATPQGYSVRWRGLAHEYIKQKLRQPGPAGSRHFVQTGFLSAEINEVLRNLFNIVFEPKVSITKLYAPSRAKAGKELARLNVRVFKTDASGPLKHVMMSGDMRAAEDFTDLSLMTKYLQESLDDKILNRFSRTQKQRPFIAPIVAYFILNRIPHIIAQSIEEVIREHYANRGR